MILRGTTFSQALEMDTGISVILPCDLSGDEPYQVCYLLHGICGNSENFIAHTMLPVYALEYRTVFVMPEAARSFYTDMRRGQKFFTYVAEELPETCLRLFNISARREDTAVMGTSMGGYGALKCAFNHPDRFGAAAAFAPPCLYLGENIPALRTPEGAATARETYGEQLYTDMLSIHGDDFAWRPENDIPALAAKLGASAAKPRVYLCCGDQDYMLPEITRFAAYMKTLAFDFTFEQWPGDHDWYFFDQAVRKALAWCYGPSSTSR